MPWALIAGAVAGIGNYMAKKSANDRAAMIYDQNFQQWMNLHIPDPAEQKIALQRFITTGEMVPEMQKAISQDPSAFEKIVSNQEYTAAQNRALGEMSKIGYEGGLRLQDKAALQDATLKGQAQERANRQGIVDEMARRGMGGSGYDVAARLQGQQGVADRMASSSLKVAADAQDRALKAIMGAGDLASKYRSQDFEEKSAKAAAADKIDAFNTANLRDVNAANTEAINRARLYNLQNKQRVADENTRLSNSEQMYNNNLAQQNYENQMARLRGASGQAANMAGTAQQSGAILGNTISNIGKAGSQYALLKDYLGKKNNSDDDEEEEE